MAVMSLREDGYRPLVIYSPLEVLHYGNEEEL